MQPHDVLLALVCRLVQADQVGAGPRQPLGLGTVVLGQHVVLVIEPVAVLDGRLIGHDHPYRLIGGEVFQVIGHGDALRTLVLGAPLSTAGVGLQIHRVDDHDIGREAVYLPVFGYAILDVE